MPLSSATLTSENEVNILVNKNAASSEVEDIVISPQASGYRNYIPSLSTSSKAILSAMGLMAGIYYYAPSALCAEREDCALWLSNLTSKEFATIVYTTAGGLGFGVGNAYLATLSLDKLFEYIGSHPSAAGKVAALTAVTILTITQSMPLLFASLGTDSSETESVIAFSGGIPAALFGVIVFLQDGLPNTWANMSWNARQFYLNTLSYLMKLSPEQKRAQAERNYYAAEHKRVTQQAQANLNFILQQLHTMRPESYANITPLKYLFKTNAEYIQSHIVSRILNQAAIAAGVVLALNISYPFLLNTNEKIDQFLGDFLQSDALNETLTVICSLSQIYGNLALTTACTAAILYLAGRILTRTPIESVSYQSRPVLSTSVAVISLLMAALSYASINILTNKYYNGPYLMQFRTSAEAGIDLYHLRGLYKKYESLLESFTQDQREKFLFAVAREVENLKTMPLIKLQEHAETGTALAATTGIYPFVASLTEDSSDEKNGIDKADYEDIAESDEDLVRPNPCTRLYGYVSSLFFAPRPKMSTTTITTASNSIQRNDGNQVELSNSRSRMGSQKRPLKIIEGDFPRESDSITHRY